jgi:hypothetical protein
MRMSKTATCVALGLSVIASSLAVTGKASATLRNYGYSNTCLGVQGGNLTPGTRFIDYACTYSADQGPLWAYNNNVQQLLTTAASVVWKNGTFSIQNNCAGVAGPSTQQGTAVVVWPCTGAYDQNWIPQLVAETIGKDGSGNDSHCYVMRNPYSGMLLSVAPDKHIVIWPGSVSSHTRDQVWCEYESNGTFH